MTERQAWLKLAAHYERERVLRYPESGLCLTVQYWADSGELDLETADAMLVRIEREVKAHPWHNGKNVTGWAWPLTAKGHAARVKFCRRQVARLKRKAAARRKR